MKRKSLLMVLILGLLSLAFFAGCSNGGSTNSEGATNDDKTFVIGLDDSFPPMGFRDKDNNIVGFDIDLATEVAKRMGMEIKLQVVNWDTKEMELENDKVDALWNGLTITDERKAAMDFTNPYLENDQVVVVQKGSDIANIAALEGKKVGVQKGSSAYDALMDNPINTKIDGGKPVEFDENVSALQDLASGRIQAVVVDSVVARYYISSENADFTILSDTLSPELYGVAVKKGNTELRDKIQKAMDEMNADGSAAKISEKWFGENIIYTGTK
ncbi:MAG: amino acid ABC transporter substrate-binding protein [Eubacterium aggregans]|uniref:Amino acid ABC transporter substrate-binding protein, PAAT family n=1 Tax=Eubacterium aggregans TaxID=81409 RepID=A0A1H4C371_9FIRM|nr:amino acid ABC transporter substrate-binding protein [Eubacterium aggregans]MDD4691058.1 amino acid ABC transporter substrate-binding protein [Eubacterium aggregans]MEA5072890.1 amino acid ABC transporter substrate-binding protein [Eubacterium aggregans]SEA54851.1 amino acid ABC transporter substrate-binding protein, PAAT family [Eubacterium aggregans]